MASPAELRKILDGLGLGFLFDILDSASKDPSIDVTDLDAVGLFIDGDTKSQDAIKKRFIGNAYREKAGLGVLSPKEYIASEQALLQRLKDNGMPLGFYDTQEDLAKLIGGDVSAVEFNNRIQLGYTAAQNASTSVKQQLQSLYGINESELASYYLDPTRAEDVLGRKKNANLYAQQLKAAAIAGQAQTQAGIQLGALTAEDLAQTGVDAQQGFQVIGQSQELFRTTTGERTVGDQNIAQAEQISGVFGTNAAARQAIADRKRRRTAGFEGSAGFDASQQGATGLRTAGQ